MSLLFGLLFLLKKMLYVISLYPILETFSLFEKMYIVDEKMSSNDLKDQIAVTKSSMDETTNYLGFSNIHQPPMYQLLQREALVVRLETYSQTSIIRLSFRSA